MFIVMHCGGMPFNGDTIKDESLGGSETAAYYIARELAKRGHKVTIFTNSPQEGTFDGVKYICAGPQTNECPLGTRFHFYGMNTPCDVMMIQRAPGTFTYKWASKLNVCWLHDLALHRQKPMLGGAMWNVDAVFTVSEWHKKQVCDVYGLNPDIVMPVTNGVDLKLFEGKIKNLLSKVHAESGDKIKLLYSSRPERGLEHHVRPGGIMERLLDIDPRFHLYVCAYDNKVPQMASYYDALYQRIEQLPNCTNLGALTKQELADTMRQCDALVYPTEFEEVSCITSMEAMAAGLPFIASDVAALSETTKDSGAILLPLKDGRADEDAFISLLEETFSKEGADPEFYTSLQAKQHEAVKQYSWAVAAERFEQHFEKLFADRVKNPETVLRHYVHMSDYYAAEKYAAENPVALLGDTAQEEMRVCYRFARENTWGEHYKAYYEYEKNRGVEYGPENLDANTRYQHVAGLVSNLPDGSVVLDYGCAHGHYTVNLAKRFPKKTFVGVDITASNIETAKKWAADEGLNNVSFFQGYVEGRTIRAENGVTPLFYDGGEVGEFDCIIAAEVLEHVAAPWEMVDTLGAYLRPRGTMIITTPLGPWEAVGYKEHWPWRAHVHHLERADLHDLYGMHPQFKINVAPSGADRTGDALGSYICVFGRPKQPSGRIDYARKFRLTNPRQTLAVCVIAKNAELTLGKCLDSVKEIADEIIVAVDETTTDTTRQIAEKYAKGFSPRGELVFDIKSPMEIGFDEARNISIARAKADWVMWIDADEVLFHPEQVLKYLRQNQFTAYAVRQHHFTVEPAGIIRTDLPARIFRNNAGVKFFGVVHEHPEIELNKGIGHAMLLGDVSIAHYGYSTEEVRRKRFERNIELLVRDREKFPDRILGKFLWLRDLAQMCRWEAEKNGGQVTPAMRARAEQGIKVWEELLDANQLRMIADDDNLSFYTTLVQVLGEGFDFSFKLDTSKLNGGAHLERAPTYSGRFATPEHAQKLFTKLFNERTIHYGSKYF